MCRTHGISFLTAHLTNTLERHSGSFDSLLKIYYDGTLWVANMASFLVYSDFALLCNTFIVGLNTISGHLMTCVVECLNKYIFTVICYTFMVGLFSICIAWWLIDSQILFWIQSTCVVFFLMVLNAVQSVSYLKYI